ncbi:MAG: Omp28 family outer membrane lipoprotein [Muribaculaceae bacterium]|nr:Omp28 family outer membrane lipoprotein [Muribaculaceae bacterium]
MKHPIISLGIVIAAGMLAACDNIAEEDRYIKVEKPVIENPQTLLVMEFTGNRCINCPNGAAEIERIKKDEGADKVISVGLHPKGNPNTNPMLALYPERHVQDFRSDAATALYEYYNPAGFPAAVFNGQNMSTSTLDWMERASKALQKSANMSIEAECAFDPQTEELTVDYTVEFGNTISEKLNLTVWLVESDILGSQLMPDGSTNDRYIHNHVLRASLNGNWGETIANGKPGESVDSETPPLQGTASMSLKDTGWVPENCHVVVYVYRDSDKGVEQAAEAPVIKGAD